MGCIYIYIYICIYIYIYTYTHAYIPQVEGRTELEADGSVQALAPALQLQPLLWDLNLAENCLGDLGAEACTFRATRFCKVSGLGIVLMAR